MCLRRFEISSAQKYQENKLRRTGENDLAQGYQAIMINDVNPQGIMRTIASIISELGAFSAALVLQDTVCRLTNQEDSVRLADIMADYFPLYGEIIETGFSPSDIEKIIKEGTDKLAEQLRGFTSIVVVGIESVLLDRLSRKLPNTNFYIVPHMESINVERILANFPSNVRLIDIRGLMGLGGIRSVLISYVFCQMEEESFVYPVTFRAVGPDIKSSYNQIIGINMLSGYHRYLGDMAPLYSTSQFFTNQFRII